MASVKSGRVTVAAAGTAVAFPSARTKCLWIRVQVEEGNTGDVYLGDSDVSATSGLTLQKVAGGVHSFTVIPFGDYGGVDLGSLFLDAGTNGDSAEFVAVLE